MDSAESDRVLEEAFSDALATLPKPTSADKVADWVFANRWPSFPDELKNDIIHRALRSVVCKWARGQAHYYSTLSHPDAPYGDDCPF